MDRQRALFGSSIGFFVLFAIATFASGTPPKPNDSGQAIMAWITEHQTGVRWSAWCVLIAGILFIVYALVLRDILAGLAGNAFLVGAVGTGVLTTSVTWINLGLARRPGSVDPATARTLYDVASYWGPMLITFTVLTLAPLAYAGLKGGQLPKWVGALAAIVMIEQLIESVTIFGSGGFIAPGGAMNTLPGAGLTLITWLAAGVVASRRAGASARA
jgi:hypothetical protein